MRLHDNGFETDWITAFRQTRIDRCIKQCEIADKLGVDRASVCQWETGVSAPSRFEIWNRWARILGLPPVIADPPEMEWCDDED